MKRLMSLVLALVGLMVAMPVTAQVVQPMTSIVVDFEDGSSQEEIQQVAREEGINLLPNSYLALQDGIMIGSVPLEQADRVLMNLRSRALVQSASENLQMHAYMIPNDPLYPKQWGLHNAGAETAWDYTCGQGAIVAVIDTGVTCEAGNGLTPVSDLKGANCVPGYNFVSDRPHAGDDQGHGTHVAGTIAQVTNNGVGGAGMAHCASIMPVKVLDSRGSGSLADVAEGIIWAVDHGAQVLNLSLGGGSESVPLLAAAVKYARQHNVLVVAAAGNDGKRGLPNIGSPAIEEGSLAVSAIGPDERVADFSSTGPQVGISAPGVAILQQTICENGKGGCEQYASWAGTSMATPHVAGAAALLFASGVTSADAVEQILKETARAPKHGDTSATSYGSGILDAGTAVKHVHLKQGLTRLAVFVTLLWCLSALARGSQTSMNYSIGLMFTALVVGVGFFFIPVVLPSLGKLPGVIYLTRPMVDLTLSHPWLHTWLPLANAGIPFLIGTLAGPKRQHFAGAVSLGLATYLVSTLILGWHHYPLGNFLGWCWVAGNAMICFWLARIQLQR